MKNSLQAIPAENALCEKLFRNNVIIAIIFSAIISTCIFAIFETALAALAPDFDVTVTTLLIFTVLTLFFLGILDASLPARRRELPLAVNITLMGLLFTLLAASYIFLGQGAHAQYIDTPQYSGIYWAGIVTLTGALLAGAIVNNKRNKNIALIKQEKS